MQALQWGILNAHVSALCLLAAFTRLAVLVVQVGAARQAGLLYGSGALYDTSVARRPRYAQRKGPHELQSCAGAKSEHCIARMNGDGGENLGL